MRIHPFVFVAASLALSACQTAGSDGVLGSATDQPAVEGSPDQQVAAVERPPVRPGTNPNAGGRLKNTQNALTNYCPSVQIRAGTEAFRVQPDGASADGGDVKYQATITRVARECSYVGDRLNISVGAKGRVITGPTGESGSFDMPIRVAVTQGGQTVYSKLFKPQASIPQGATNNTFSFVDNEVSIPAPDALNVRIFVGFDEGPYDTL